MLLHLIELRKRIIYVLIAFSGLFLFFFIFSNDLFHLAILPLLKVLPDNGMIIATQIAAPLITPIHLALDVALLLCTPYALFQAWYFISPGLYGHEKKPLKGFFLLSLVLFLSGIAFCFFVVLPFILNFFVQSLPDHVRYMPDMNYAVNFISRMLMIFGLSFQLPLIILICVRFHWLDIQSLKTFRPYFIVLAFIVSMLLTPPDVLSQVLLAIPLCALYELGIFLATWLGKGSQSLPSAKQP